MSTVRYAIARSARLLLPDGVRRRRAGLPRVVLGSDGDARRLSWRFAWKSRLPDFFRAG